MLSRKRCHRKRSKLAVWEASAGEVGHGLRYRLLQKGYQQTAKEQQYLQYPKRDPKKDVSLWLHNTACLVMFVASIILRLPFIDPETNLRKKQMKKKSEKKKFLLHPWKSTWNLTLHLFWVPAIHFPGCTLPFTSDRCRPLLCYYAIMLLCYGWCLGWWLKHLLKWCGCLFLQTCLCLHKLLENVRRPNWWIHLSNPYNVSLFQDVLSHICCKIWIEHSI